MLSKKSGNGVPRSLAKAHARRPQVTHCGEIPAAYTIVNSTLSATVTLVDPVAWYNSSTAGIPAFITSSMSFMAIIKTANSGTAVQRPMASVTFLCLVSGPSNQLALEMENEAGLS